MTSEEALLKLNDHDHDINSLKHRVDKVEEKQESIDKLAQSVNELALNMRYMLEEQQEQGKRLKKLETEPLEDAKTYKRQMIIAIITAFVSALVGGIIGYFI